MFRSYAFFRRINNIVRRPLQLRKFLEYPKRNIVNVLIASKLCTNVVVDKMEDATKIDIHKALEEGDASLLSLMEQIKNFVTVVSKEYRLNMKKQIEITQKASQLGQLNEAWDELLEYRSLCDQLLNEINEYLVIFNTVGELAKDESLRDFVTGSDENLPEIGKTFKEFEKFIAKEIAENKRVENELLKAKCDSILTEINTNSS